MLEIVFKYRDKYSYPKWNTQTCLMRSVAECKRVYGLGEDCEYEILSVETEEDAKLRRATEYAANAIISLAKKKELREALEEELAKILTYKTFEKAYLAFEGDVRVIFNGTNGFPIRYTLSDEGRLIEKP